MRWAAPPKTVVLLQLIDLQTELRIVCTPRREMSLCLSYGNFEFGSDIWHGSFHHRAFPHTFENKPRYSERRDVERLAMGWIHEAQRPARTWVRQSSIDHVRKPVEDVLVMWRWDPLPLRVNCRASVALRFNEGFEKNARVVGVEVTVNSFARIHTYSSLRTLVRETHAGRVSVSPFFVPSG